MTLKGPKVRDAFAMLMGTDIDLSPLDVPATWYVDTAGKIHGQVGHAGESAISVTSTLLAFLDSPRCATRACSTIVSICGEAGQSAGHCAQHLAEAAMAIGNLTLRDGAPVRVIQGEQRARRDVDAAFVRIATHSPSPVATKLWKQYFDDVITAAVARAHIEMRTPEHRQHLVDQCIDGLLARCEPVENLSGLLLGTTLGDTVRDIHDRRSERREARVVTAEEAAAVADTVDDLTFNFANQLRFISLEVPIALEPGQNLLEVVTTAWRSDVRRKALSFGSDLERERQILAADTDLHLVAVPASVVLGAYPRGGLPAEVIAAFGAYQGSCILLAPAPVAAWMVVNYFSKSIVVDPAVCDLSALETLDTLLKDDVRQGDGGTFTHLDTAWEAAQRLVSC